MTKKDDDFDPYVAEILCSPHYEAKPAPLSRKGEKIREAREKREKALFDRKVCVRKSRNSTFMSVSEYAIDMGIQASFELFENRLGELLIMADGKAHYVKQGEWKFVD